MAVGYSLHIGVNQPDSSKVQLTAPERIAGAFEIVADARGFHSQLLLGRAATRDAVLGELRRVRAGMTAADIFLLTFAGHGNTVGSIDDHDAWDRADGLDECWCCYDALIADDELREELAQFPPGSRVVVFSESCFSGGMNGLFFRRQTTARHGVVSEWFAVDTPPAAVPYKPGVRWLMACDEGGLAFVGSDRGWFSEAVFEALNANHPDYARFIEHVLQRVVALSGGKQIPHFDQAGPDLGKRWGSPLHI